MIGILTEIIGSPTPMRIPAGADKQLPQGDWPLPIAPQEWHYRQSIDYEITQQSRHSRPGLALSRDVPLQHLAMGRNSIEKGSQDNWTITPKRIAALEAAAASCSRRRDAAVAVDAAAEAAPAAATFRPAAAAGGLGARDLPTELYNTVLHDPKLRDPRGYIIPSDQADFATATEFINALMKNGITVIERATAAFTVDGKSYPAGSYVVKTAQAFRPHVMDMFEPQDHPNDFAYPGGPPKPPLRHHRLDARHADGRAVRPHSGWLRRPVHKVNGLAAAARRRTVTGSVEPGRLPDQPPINNSFIVMNRLLKAGRDVYWLKKAEKTDGAGPGHRRRSGCRLRPPRGRFSRRARRILAFRSTRVAKAPTGEAMKLKPIRIGLYDQYGGSMPSGWTRWLFEQYEFPFEVVYPATLDAGDLKSKFDVIVFIDGAIRRGGARRTRRRRRRRCSAARVDPEHVPGRISRPWWAASPTTRPCRSSRSSSSPAASIVTIGSSTSIAEVLRPPGEELPHRKGRRRQGSRAAAREVLHSRLAARRRTSTTPIRWPTACRRRWTCSSTTARFPAWNRRRT